MLKEYRLARSTPFGIHKYMNHDAPFRSEEHRKLTHPKEFGLLLPIVVPREKTMFALSLKVPKSPGRHLLKNANIKPGNLGAMSALVVVFGMDAELLMNETLKAVRLVAFASARALARND